MRGLTRRQMLLGAAAEVGAMALGRSSDALASDRPIAGRLKQSVSRWPFRAIALPDFCRAVRAMGIVAIDLLQKEDWERVRDCGLRCSMGYPGERRNFIAAGFNDPANHPLLLAELERTIPLAPRHGVPNIIAMFGNRQGRSDDEGADHCITGLNAIKALAEEHRVTICLELLNSKVDHLDYQGDRTAFGVRVVRAVGSPYVKLLYDIYHMQIMEGDVIRTIREHRDFIAHFHTGGVPGRGELDDTQELNYGAVARAIADTGFAGYVAHEFVPRRDPLASLREAVAVCSV